MMSILNDITKRDSSQLPRRSFSQKLMPLIFNYLLKNQEQDMDIPNQLPKKSLKTKNQKKINIFDDVDLGFDELYNIMI